ncbi:MAG: DNA polymerase I [Candidatus Saccharibacteria bacterium]
MTEAEEQAIAGSKRKKLAIIDGKSVFYRGYYAMPNLSTKDGTPTGGVFGFASMALEVLRRLKPDYVCVAWDKPKTNIRKRLELYPQYKANRKPPPPDFYEQIPILHDLLDAFGWPLYELDDYEADDIMGTLAVQATAKDIETMLITSDLDMLQLVNPHVHVFALKKGLSNIELYSPSSFEAKYSIEVEQFLDLKALKGDSSDNIPGVPGIGEKGAIDLLKEYKTLDGIYDNLDLIRETTRKKLVSGKDLAYLSKQLAAIWLDAPITLDTQAVDGSKVNITKVHDLLEKLEFRSLVRQLPQIMQLPVEAQAPAHLPSKLQVGKAIIIDSRVELNKLDLGKTGKLFIHSRAAGKHGRDPRYIALSNENKTVYLLEINKLDGADIKRVLNVLQDSELVGYDIKSTLKVLLNLKIELPPVGHDVLVGAFLLDSLRRVQSLDELAKSDLGYEGPGFDNLSDEEFVTRVPEIMAIIDGLYKKQTEDLRQFPKLLTLAKEVDWPVIPVLAGMEYQGIELNCDYLKKFSVEIDDSVSDLEQQIYGYADKDFNISSPSQLAEVLFNDLALPTKGIKKGKTGYSTAASELDKLRGQHPVIDLVSQYREVSKLKSTYVDALPRQVDENSRLHTTFNLTIAQTGRLSSTDPNLQNIPIRTELGKRIRTAFVAGPGNVFVSADYSQFELRIAAALSGDEGMTKAFNSDSDIHIETAAAVYGIPSDQVTKTQRYAAKAVNFGIMYGQGPHGLSQGAGMPFGEARDFIARYFEIRPQLKKYIESLRDKAKDDGYVETLLGRRRPTPDAHSSNFAVREAAYRAAVNMPVQGTAADLMKLAMVAVDKQLEPLGAKQLLQIHDSILVECPEAEAERVAEVLKQTMESIYELPVILKVDVTTGKNWGEL